MIRFGDTAETSILEDVQTVMNAHPQIPGSIFEHVRDLITGETMPASNRRDRPVPDFVERAVVCNPDRAISTGQNPYSLLSPQPSGVENVTTRDHGSCRFHSSS
jgi:hypothetical protein